MDLNLLRLVEIANICMFLYLAWMIDFSYFVGPRSRFEIDLTNFMFLLAIVPFLAAFITSFQKELTGSKWLLIRAIHQALMIVTLVIAAISLVGLPDTAPATICVTVFTLLQLVALRTTRLFVPTASTVRQWPIKVFRVAMVFLFAFLFLLVK
jgi:hypothetical protein